MELFPSEGKPIYFRWWFWAILFFLVCGTLYAVKYNETRVSPKIYYDETGAYPYFEAPKGTHLVSKRVDGVILNYYASTTAE